MRDLDKALADIASIRSQLAAGTMFRGFGPAVIAATGGLALLTMIAQWIWPDALDDDVLAFIVVWMISAFLSVMLIGVEMHARSRRHHGGLADQMIFNAIELFLPAAIAGIALAVVFTRFNPDQVWMLPGLWQILMALGLFASVRMLPRAISLVASWYFLAGVTVLILASADQQLSPLLMGLPFVIGQLAMAAVLHFACGGADGED